MPIDFDELVSSGGEALVDLLDYSVRAMVFDVLFVFLVREYQQQPTGPKAVALYDGFCASHALAPLSVPDALRRHQWQLEAALRQIKSDFTRQEVAGMSGTPGASMILPPKFLFDSLTTRLREDSAAFRHVRDYYNPDLTPLQNLPGGRMTANQRNFVDKIWTPKLRPVLVRADFRRVASIA